MAGNFWHSSHFGQWLFEKEEMLLGRQGDLKKLSVEEYHKVHIFFGHFIQAIGEELKVRQQVIATAMIYFKRFYSRYSLKDIDPLLLCPTSLFLASKVEECGACVNSRVIEKCIAVVRSQRFSSVFNIDYPYKVNDVHDCEFLLMEVLDCCLVVFQPYRPLALFCEDLNDVLKDPNNELLKASWCIINDILRSDLILTQPPFLLALAALLIASCTYKKARGPGMGLDTSSFSFSGMPPEIRNWFVECTVDMDCLGSVVSEILAFFELSRSFNEQEEMMHILKKFHFIKTIS